MERFGILNSVFALWCICFSGYCEDSAYWNIDQYQDLHPQEKQLSIDFSALVREDPKPVSLSVKEPVKILIVYPGKQISDYWRRSVIAFESRLKALNINYALEVHYTRPVVASSQQERLLALTKKIKPDYLIFTLDTLKHQELISKLLDDPDAPKLILQNITTPLKQWETHQPFLYVGFDHIEGTKLLADYYRNITQGQGSYAMLYWARGYVSESRGDSFIEMMRSSSELKLSSSHYTNASRNSAYQQTLAALNQNSHLNFIYACSTDVALGASEAIKERDLQGKVLVNGWGGGSAELKAIADGGLDVTVMRINDDNGVAMAEAVKLDLLGESNNIPQIYSGEFRLIDKTTSEAELNALRQLAFRYSDALLIK